MPKAKPVASLSGLVDTDMEDDALNMDAFPTPDSNQENLGSARRAGRPAKSTAKKFAPSKAVRRRASGGAAPTKKAAPKKKTAAKRAPLKEKTSARHAEDTEEVDEFAGEGNEDTVTDELVETKQPTKRKAPAKKARKQPKKKAVEQIDVPEEAPAQQSKAMEKDGEFEYTPTTTRQTRRPGRPAAQKPKGNKHQTSVEAPQQKIIPETQVAMEIDQSEAPEQNEEDDEALPQSVFRRTNNLREKNHQRQPLMSRKRAGSASDNERGGSSDPGTRRKLGEMTTKFEKLETRYKTLKDTGIKEANANFEKYKTQVQANTKAANDLIVSLKRELATQKTLSKDSASLENQIITRDADLAKTQTLAAQLSTSLSDAQNENKALQAKLAHSRSASAAVESLGANKTPGSAMRGKTPAPHRTIMVGSAEAAHAAQVAQLKEDLYSDLTGLILRGVERKDESDVYDCIQTGRNGTLHFKLSVAKDTDGGYEDTEFQYTPRLDGNRDRDLIALLPEYLTDEITFSRTNAAMFYGRVVETLTKKRPVEVLEE